MKNPITIFINLNKLNFNFYFYLFIKLFICDNPNFQEIRRQQAAQAAERRIQQLESRGVKNPESVKRLQDKQKELEELEKRAAIGGQGNLRWQAD